MDGWFFVALPDCEGTGRIAQQLAPDVYLISRHASGRPLLFARLPAAQRVTAQRGSIRAAVIGVSSATEELVRGALGRTSGTDALDGLSHTLADSFHLIGADGDRLRVQGSSSGVRRVFHAMIDGVRVVCDRADVLAGLGGFPLDDTELAIRLLRVLPHPLAEEPMWRGVSAVPPGSALLVEGGGRRGKGEEVPTVVQLPTGKALTVRAAADMFLDSLGNPNTVRSYGIGVGKTAERLGEVRPLASVADDEIARLWNCSGAPRR